MGHSFRASMSINNWLMISIIVFVVSILLAGVYAWRVKKARVGDPIFIFLFFFALFVLPLPWRTYFTKSDVGDVTKNLTAIFPYMPVSVLMCATGLPFFVLAYYSELSRWTARCVPRPRTGAHARMSVLAIGTVSLIMFGLLARDFGGILGFILLGYHNYEVTAGRGYLWISLVWLPIAAEFLLYNYVVGRRKLDLALFVGMSGCLVLMFLILGGRALIMYFGLTVWLFWHHAISPLSIRKLALIGIPIFLVLNLVGALRESRYQTLADVWEKAKTNTPLALDESGTLFYTLTTGEFVVPFETFPQMVKSVGDDVHLQWGLTYLEAPLLVIPTAIFPDRPEALQNWYMRKYYGLDSSGNENRSFFFLSEGYLNFGPAGVIATMVVWGILLGSAHNYVRLARGEPGAVLLYALTASFIFRGIAGHAGSWLAGLTSQGLGMAVIGIWIANGGVQRLFCGRVLRPSNSKSSAAVANSR